MKRQYCRAFTLLELLTVMIIIAVLAGLLFASFGPAREKSREQVCTSNLHQWGAAFAMYMADYDGMEPVKGVPLKPSQLGLPTGGPSALAFDKQYKLFNTPVAFCPSAHYPPIPESKGRRATSYYHNFITDDDDTARRIGQFGPEYPMMVCDMHNADRDWGKQPTWATKRVNALLLNQQVVFRTVSAHSGSAGY